MFLIGKFCEQQSGAGTSNYFFSMASSARKIAGQGLSQTIIFFKAIFISKHPEQGCQSTIFSHGKKNPGQGLPNATILWQIL